MKKSEPLQPDVFLKSAQFMCREYLAYHAKLGCCHSIYRGALDHSTKAYVRFREYIQFFKERFEPAPPHGMFYWPRSARHVNSRILALLLCREMLKGSK